jgi:prefoldin subunit 2
LHGPWLLITPLDAAFSPLIANRAGRLVLETLEPLPGDRKCFRMINGVLVERTIQDVVPALRTNAEGLKKVLDDLVKQYKAKQDELEKWKVREKDCPACSVIPPALTVSQKKNNVQVVQS